MTDSPEFSAKCTRLREWLLSQDADAVLLLSPPNLYWLALGGEVARPTSLSSGFVVTADACSLLCPAEDRDRLRQEEIRGLEIELVALERLDTAGLVSKSRALADKNARWLCDTPGWGLEFNTSVHELRRTLLNEEAARLRKLGHDAAAAVEEVASECYRGIQEREAAARLAAECVLRNMRPSTILVGADERVENYSRPAPKSGAAEQILQLSLVAMRGGLHVALARTICLSHPSVEFVNRFTAMQLEWARLRHASRSGASLGGIVQNTFAAPTEVFGSLGGLAGYAIPEVEAHADCDWTLANSQALAWSVCAPGIRCEDTLLVNDTGNELLTMTEGWPRRKFKIEARGYDLPDLLML